MDYLVKLASNIYIIHFLLFVFVENHIFRTFDLGNDFLTLKMTLKKTILFPQVYKTLTAPRSINNQSINQ